MASLDEIKWPTKVVSDLLGLTVARIGQLAKDGIISKNTDGTFSPRVITQYVEWLRRPAGKMQTDYQKLSEKEKYRKLKRENDIEERKLIPLEEMSDILQQVAKVIVSILEALPLKIKRRVPALKARNIEHIKLEIAKCRNAIADIKVDK